MGCHTRNAQVRQELVTISWLSFCVFEYTEKDSKASETREKDEGKHVWGTKVQQKRGRRI